MVVGLLRVADLNIFSEWRPEQPLVALVVVRRRRHLLQQAVAELDEQLGAWLLEKARCQCMQARRVGVSRELGGDE